MTCPKGIEMLKGAQTDLRHPVLENVLFLCGECFGNVSEVLVLAQIFPHKHKRIFL
jgi:hypothetical protein